MYFLSADPATRVDERPQSNKFVPSQRLASSRQAETLKFWEQIACSDLQRGGCSQKYS